MISNESQPTSQETYGSAEDTAADLPVTEYEVTEGVLLSDEDIARLRDAIVSAELFSPGKYTQARGTDELDLSVAGPIPYYFFHNTGNLEHRGGYYLIFDGDRPVLLVSESLNNEAGNAVENIGEDYKFDGKVWDRFEDIVSQSTTRTFAIIAAASGIYLYDGVDAMPYRYNYSGGFCSDLASVVSETPGIETVELAGIDVRQHFDF